MIFPQSSDLFSFQCLFASAVPVLLFCAGASAQARIDADASVLVGKIDAARGRSGKPAETLAVEGTLAVTFEGTPANDETVLKGTFREVYSGASRAGHRIDLGELGGVLESGMTEDLVWEIDPVAGAKIHSGAPATALRRYSALLRGAGPSELYREIARAGSQDLDGRAHVLLRMTPPEGKADTWYVDAETGRVGRVDISLPVTEGGQLVWGMDEAIENQVTFGDWKPVGGVLFPHRRRVKMGPATYTFTCTKVEPGPKVDPSSLGPPDSVTKLRNRPAPKAASATGGYQVVEREAQPVASIRVKCKPGDMSSKLAELFPEICGHLASTGAKMTGLPYTRYHDTSASEIDLEAGIPVVKPFAEKGRVKNGELPAGKAVMAWHLGPYEKLAEAHRSLRAYLDANRLKPRGAPWEIYWTDPGMVPDPSKWRTQLFLPVEE
jgi:effector-binding domain-containing protein